MKSYEAKARDYYGEVVINKGLMSKAGFGARAVPVYVGEWIVSQFLEISFVLFKSTYYHSGIISQHTE